MLVLGATGAAGQLAVQVARHLAAGRVVVAGRNQSTLDRLVAGGADAAVRLGDDDDEVIAAYQRSGGDAGYDVVLDYLWGRPVECFARSLLTAGADNVRRPVRLLQVGAMAGPDAASPASALRGTGPSLMGSGVGSIDPRAIFRMIPEVWRLASEGILRMDVETVPLSGIEAAWQRGDHDGRRLVAIP